MLFMYVLGLWINYGTVNRERCYVIPRGCRHTASVNLPSQRKHTCNLSDLTAADRERERQREKSGEEGVGWHCMQRGREVANRQKDKGRLNERESSWKMADSFLVQERSSHWSEGDTVPFPAPPGADTSRHRKVILLFPLSPLTDCHSQISSLTLSVSAGLFPFLTFIDIDRDKPFCPLSINNCMQLFR